jgi:hypothetical protein
LTVVPRPIVGVAALPASAARPFDLNIEEVLEHWGVAEALRELIANALDEQALTSTAEPEIVELGPGRWRIRDWGRGLRYEHFTQKEDPEKLRKRLLVIGKFGFGLKDAVGALDRRGVRIHLRSRHAEIGIERLPKHGFSDIKTLHAVIEAPAYPEMLGTEIILEGVNADHVAAAKQLFLKFSGEETLEATQYGAVLRRGKGEAKIYVNGLRVAEEPNFLFSYNITSLTKPLRDALNRERSNVGRQAYSDRVKTILKACSSESVADKLAEDLASFQTGRSHDETAWLDVSLHACKILNAHQKVVFVTAEEQHWDAGLVVKARDEGYRVVVVPESVASHLNRLTDLKGNPMRDLNHFLEEWNESFQFDFVAPEALSPKEKKIFALVGPVLALAKLEARRVTEVLISNTMRLSGRSGNEAVGVWEASSGRIVVKRDQLHSAERFAGTLLHEIGHAFTGAPDVNVLFEEGLTQLLGKAGRGAVERQSVGASDGNSL